VSWHCLPRIYRDIATQVCTPAELDALALHIAGYSDRQIARTLSITRSTVRYRLDNATRKISDHPQMPRETETA